MLCRPARGCGRVFRRRNTAVLAKVAMGLWMIVLLATAAAIPFAAAMGQL
jgi:hypothetical protein